MTLNENKTHDLFNGFIYLCDSVLGVHVLSASALIQDVLTAYQQEKQTASERQMKSQVSIPSVIRLLF